VRPPLRAQRVLTVSSTVHVEFGPEMPASASATRVPRQEGTCTGELVGRSDIRLMVFVLVRAHARPAR
jgi:hypothetical protein